MTLWTLAWRGISRQASRFLLFFLGLTITVSGVLIPIFLATSMERVLGDNFDVVGANILVLPPKGQKDMPLSAEHSILSIHNKENISTISPKLLGIVRVANQTDPVTVMGVRIADELRLKKWWKINGQLPASSNREGSKALVGDAVASKFGWQPGSKLTLENGGLKQEFTVTGVLAPMGTDEDSMIMAEFESVENLLGSSGAAHLFEVAALCFTCPIDEIVEQISHQLPVSRVASVKEAVEQRQATVERFSLFAMATGGILALTGILLVSLTAAAQAREKFWEIALLRSIGFRRSKLLVWLSSQSALAALLAGLAGYGAAEGASRLLWPFLSPGVAMPNLYGSEVIAATAVCALLVSLLTTTPVYARAVMGEPLEMLQKGWGV